MLYWPPHACCGRSKKQGDARGFFDGDTHTGTHTRTHATFVREPERHMGTEGGNPRVLILVKIHLAPPNYLADIAFIKFHLRRGTTVSSALYRSCSVFLMHGYIRYMEYDMSDVLVKCRKEYSGIFLYVTHR